MAPTGGGEGTPVVLRDGGLRLKVQFGACLVMFIASIVGIFEVIGNLSRASSDMPAGVADAFLAVFIITALAGLYLMPRIALLRVVVRTDTLRNVRYWWTITIQRSNIAEVEVGHKVWGNYDSVYLVLKDGKRILASAVTDGWSNTGSEDLRRALGLQRKLAGGSDPTPGWPTNRTVGELDLGGQSSPDR